MKFLFHKSYVTSQDKLQSKADPEIELKINPATSSDAEFKDFTYSYIFSSLRNSELLDTINSKLDKVIEAQEKTDLKVEKLEEELSELKTDFKAAMEFKDSEIISLQEQLEQGAASMLKMQGEINELAKKHDRDMETYSKSVNKLHEETLTLERYTRSFNLRIFKIPETPNEKSKDVMEKVNHIIADMTRSDTIKVEYGHRTGPKRKDGKPRAVICRIASRLERAVVMSKRKEFFNAGFPVYDDLPAADLAEKKKHADAMQTAWDNKQKTQFKRGKWYLNDKVFDG